MREIWIPLALITLFIFLHIIRPGLKKLKTIDGLAWLPLLALISTLALIPAYGFRPETLPLLLYSAVLTVIVFFKQINGDIKFRSFGKGRFVLIFFPLVLLAAAGATAFYFTPQKDLSFSTLGVHTLNANGYTIRIYTDDIGIPEKRPLLVILPPELGSLAVIDETACDLRDSGFTVLACARNRNFNPAKTFRMISAFFSGNVSAAANKRGRALEDRRKEDITFIISWICQNPRIEGTVQLFNIASRDAVYLTGYDTGGSALILLEDSFSGTSRDAITIQSLIAIEAPLWSLYTEQANQIPDIPADAGWYDSVKLGIHRWLLELKPKKIAVTNYIPELSTPVLFLVSDWSRDYTTGPKRFAGQRPGRYEALHKCFSLTKDRAFLVSADSASPLDYSDFPAHYPLIMTLLKANRRSEWNTAAIITYFAESVYNTGEGESRPLKHIGLQAGIQIEVNRK